VKDSGLFYPDGSFRTSADIRRKANPVTVTPNPNPRERDIAQWTSYLRTIQEARGEMVGLPNHVEITHSAHEPVHYSLIGDTHVGGDAVDYDRIYREVMAIKETEGTNVITLGDLVDNFFWQPASEGDIVNREEQALYAQQILRELQGKLRIGVLGNHDEWSARSGQTMYHNFERDFNAHLMSGISYLTLGVGDSQFRIAMSHQFGGHSIYNNSHAAMRAYRETAAGADIVVTAHTHRKGVIRQPVHEWGRDHEVTFISLGAYKATDEYSRKKGYPPMGEDEMGGVGLIFYPDNNQVDVYTNIERSIEEFRKVR